MYRNGRFLLRGAMVAAVLSLTLAASSARATDRYVATTGSDMPGNGSADAPFATIAAAVAAADAGDTIHVAAGTYLPAGTTVIEKDLTIVGAGMADTIVDGSQCSGRILDLAFGAIAIRDMKLQNGTDSYDGGDGGGAVRSCRRATVTFTRCTFAGCRAPLTLGGAISNLGALTLEDCTFEDNTSALGGAVANNALYYEPRLVAVNCRFVGNRAHSYHLEGISTGLGGAIGVAAYSNTYYPHVSSMRLTGCVFDGNQAPYQGRGAAIFLTSGDLTATGCLFTRSAGVPIYTFPIPYHTSPNTYAEVPVTAAITNCAFVGNAGNTGQYGIAGGIYTGHVALTVTNCAFVGNTGDRSGGIASSWGRIRATNCSFYGNTGAKADAILVESQAQAQVANCVVRRGAGGSAPSMAAALNDGDQGSVTVSSSDVEGWAADRAALAEEVGADRAATKLVDGGGNIETDPLFVRNPSPGIDGVWATDDDDYGDLRLQPGSPCIDAGSNAAVTSLPFLTDPAGVFLIDLDGSPRIAGASVDMGACEYQPAPGIGQTLRLKADVRALAAQVLLPADGQSLYAKLDAALAYLNAGDRLGATGSLTAFSNQVIAFAQTGRLTQAQADGLLAQAQALLAELG